MVAALVLAVVAGAAGGLAARLVDRPDRPDTVTVIGADPATAATRPADSVAGVAEAVLPCVVSISVADATGSGFVISADGYVLTNNHVVAGVDEDEPVELGLFDGRRVKAEIVGRSPSYDLAVLHTDAPDLEPVILGESEAVAVGDPVIAVGSPLGLEGTVTSGIISALDRPVTAGDNSEQSYMNALQTDAAINPGNSGGPLVDAEGRVIGVNSAIASLGLGAESGSIGLGFAIPIDQAKRTAGQLIETGEAVHPVIGVLLDDAYSGVGARVRTDTGDTPAVTPGGPADEAGISPGDVIVAIDGERVDGAGELVVALRAREPGEDVVLEIERDGDTHEVTVTLGAAVG